METGLQLNKSSDFPVFVSVGTLSHFWCEAVFIPVTASKPDDLGEQDEASMMLKCIIDSGFDKWLTVGKV